MVCSNRWQFEDEKVEYTDRISKLANGSLRIGSVTMADSGSWTIVADNRLGQVARKQIAVKVHPNRMPIEVSPGNGRVSKVKPDLWGRGSRLGQGVRELTGEKVASYLSRSSTLERAVFIICQKILLIKAA